MAEDNKLWRNLYSHCGEQWDDEGDFMETDICEKCGEDVEPYHAEQIDTGAASESGVVTNADLHVAMANPSQSAAQLATILAAEEGKGQAVSEYFNLLDNAIPSDIAYEYLNKVKGEELSPEAAAEKANERAQALHKEQHVRDVVPYYNMAERWALKEHLTVAEACHGVAREAYKHRAMGGRPPPMVEDFNPGDTYSKLYDDRKADDIRAKLTRPAREIFD